MEKHESDMASSRRGFISTLAIGTASLGLSSFGAENLGKCPAFADPGTEAEAWINKINGKYRMVFDVPHPNGIYPFAWPRVFLMTNQATGAKENDCCAVVVLRHTAIPYAFENSMWEKYNFGEVFDVRDENKNPLNKNPFWQPAPGTYKVAGVGEVAIGINELQKSGVLYGVCSLASTVFSHSVSAKINKPADEILKDWMSHLLPGIQPVPSGIWALGRAQEKGCSYVFAG
jgi:hypothetical protein